MARFTTEEYREMERRRKNIERTCASCSAKFYARAYDIKRDWAKYCSISCCNKNSGQRGGENNGYFCVDKGARRRAQDVVRVARDNGTLTPEPCAVCGTNDKIHAHHCDYGKPLEVMWLCHKHHMEWHRKNRAVYPTK